MPVSLISGRKRPIWETGQRRDSIGYLNMNAKTIIAVVLVGLGIVVLAYSGITFTTPGKSVEFLGMRIQTTDRHFIPPVVGALALVGGVVLLAVKPRRV
jgi:hypothetical protein